MWTVVAFFYTLLSALLGFVIKYITTTDNDWKINEPSITMAGAFIGCFLSGFGIYMLSEYGRYIRSGWNRANYIRYRIKGFSEIWCYNDQKLLQKDMDEKSKIDNTIPRVAKRLIALMAFSFITFLFAAYGSI